MIDKQWEDPCKAAMEKLNTGIYNSRGKRGAEADVARVVAEVDSRDRRIAELERESVQQRETILRLERQLARQALVEKSKKEPGKGAAGEEQAQFLQDVAFDRKPPARPKD